MVEEMMPVKNPLDTVLDAKTEKRAQRDSHHLQLWETWKQQPTPANLKPLLKQFEPTFGAAINNWKAPNLNESAFKAELQSRAIKALEVYNPNRGASLVTHVTNYIKKAKRFNTRSQNMAYIPEDKTKYIGKIDAAIDQLVDEHGRAPTDDEIGKVIGIPGSRVKEIQGLRRGDIVGSTFASDPMGHTLSRDAEVIDLLRPELKGVEQQVFDLIYGKNGQPKMESTGAIAKRLGMSDSQVSRVKNRIAETYKKYL